MREDAIKEVIENGKPIGNVAIWNSVDVNYLSRQVMNARRKRFLPIEDILKESDIIYKGKFPSLTKISEKVNVNILDLLWVLQNYRPQQVVKISTKELQLSVSLYKTFTHYRSDDAECPKDICLDEEEEKRLFMTTGKYIKWAYDVVPIKSIKFRLIRDNGYDNIVRGIKNLQWIPPIRIYFSPTEKYNFVTLDGSHRITASLDCGYTKVPAFVQWKLNKDICNGSLQKETFLKRFPVNRVLKKYRDKYIHEDMENSSAA